MLQGIPRRNDPDDFLVASHPDDVRHNEHGVLANTADRLPALLAPLHSILNHQGIRVGENTLRELEAHAVFPVIGSIL
jgi:hypothetical protein